MRYFFPRSRKAKIITAPLKYSGTGIHTFKYFEDDNLSLSKRSVYPAQQGRKDCGK